MTRVTRREALGVGGAVTASVALAGRAAAGQTGDSAVKRGRLKQSVCRWCYEKIPLEEFSRGVAAMRLTAIDLLQPEEWEVAARYGLLCSTGYPGKGGGTIPDGLNNRALHDQIVNTFAAALPRARKAKVPNLITFFGNRQGRSDEEAIDSCIAALGRIKPMAEDNEVTVVVELLNSKVDHRDYHGDHTSFGVKVMKAVNSPRIKLLYDIYHMQIMEGDIIRTIQQNKELIAHYHTGGVPGRHELDPTQELQWPAIAKAILDTGYTGYFAHEFIPTREPLVSLREAVQLCDV
jgi:hydroxypyruvate isomerase